MFGFLYRQRRRLLFTMFFGTIALMMMAFGSGEIMAAMGGSTLVLVASLILTSVIVGLCILIFSTAVLLILPRWRQLLELTAFNLFVYATLNQFVPGVFALPFIGAFLPFVLWMFVYAVVYGELLDRFHVWLDHSEKRRYYSPKPADQLWRELVPGESDTAEHWDSLLYELEAVEDDPDSLDVKYTHGASLYEIQTMTFLERQSPTHAKYYHVGQVDPKNRSLVEGTYEILIEPCEDRPGCHVWLYSHMSAMLPRQALGQWFDDALGDRADHLSARDTGRRDWSMTGLYRRKVSQFA